MMRQTVLFLAIAAIAAAQGDIPQLQWKVEPAGPGLLKLSSSLPEPWHLYSASSPVGLKFTATVDGGAAAAVYQKPPKVEFDPNFQAESETYEKDIVFYVAPAAETAAGEVTLKLRYQICTDKQCVPQRKTAAGTFAPGAVKVPEGFALAGGAAAKAAPATSSAAGAAAPATTTSNQDSQSLGAYLATAFGLGLAALFTPCVFPMIPFVMSGFLNRESGSKADGIAQAGIFSAGIIILFCVLGFAVTAILGPFGVVQLGSSPWVNSFIAILFGVFGLSLLGAFEITLPAWLTSAADEKSRQGGTVGTLMMSLSFALTSFACVGPFVGTLLAGSIQAAGIRPVLGMATFATGLAAPFFFLALFPQYIKRMPKSGGWLARVKVVMGFLVLAGMLKYLSNIDAVLQWNILTRERFLAAWVVLFSLAGLYLLGFLRLEGIGPNDHMGVGRLLTGAFFLIFGIHLLPGMFCGRLGELDAYIPPPAQGCAVSGGAEGTASANKWLKNEYAAALAKAKAENKNVLINFTGYACTNCHWMKQNMFPKPEVQEAIANLVLVELYTDGTDQASEENQKIQDSKFKTVAIPYYAIVTPDERVVASFAGLTKDTAEFVAFLKRT
ncbi:thiol:disulfide interchange protein DsbD [Bryobacterales bacterium F-183]|nr:thiol:disulfide interchange protein DsbD [Bryobacterales bacterium F-183]